MNPWVVICTHPRQTIRQIVDSNPRQHLLFLVTAAGAAIGLIAVGAMDLPVNLPLFLKALLAMSIGMLVGLGELYLASFIYYMVGKKLAGQATLPEVRAVVAWSEVPLLWFFCLWFLLLVFSGGELLKIQPGQQVSDPGLRAILFIFAVAFQMTVTWRLLLISHMMAEVNRFSFFRGVLSVAIPIMLFLCLNWMMDRLVKAY